MKNNRIRDAFRDKRRADAQEPDRVLTGTGETELCVCPGRPAHEHFCPKTILCISGFIFVHVKVCGDLPGTAENTGTMDNGFGAGI